jgi:hypothetical protein
MLASITALPRAKNSFTSSSRLSPRLRDIAWANSAQCPGGNSEWGPSAQYSALIRLGSSRFSVSCSRLMMSSGDQSPLGSLGGPGTSRPNWDVMPNGITSAHWGVRARWGLPVPSGTRSGCQRQRSITWSGVLTGR